jgi:ABC-type transporter Mla MlaB component
MSLNQDQATITPITQERVLVSGIINFDTISRLRDQGNQFILQSYVIFDLAKVQQFDSSSLALLLAWRRFAHANDKVISFLNVPSRLVEVAQLSGLDHVLQLINNKVNKE